MKVNAIQRVCRRALVLVAPIAPGATSRDVVLPPGRWYDFNTGAFAGENQKITISPALGEIPLFVKDGALIPMIVGDRQYAPAAGERVALEVRHDGERPGSLVLYDDDEETFAYERGEFSRTGLSVAKEGAGPWSGKVVPDSSGRPWSYSDGSWTFMTK